MQLDQLRVEQLAESYFEHLWIIIRDDDRGANLRDFVDPWWSFSRGHPFVGGKYPHYSQRTMNNPCACGHEHKERLRRLDWISDGAAAAKLRRVCKNILKEGRNDLRSPSDRLVVDHSVPLAKIYQGIFIDHSDWEKDDLKKFLTHHMKRALLTSEEDRALDEVRDGQSLKSEMPRDWKWWDDPFARYHARAIAGGAP
ncbi:hypothetical protein [Rhizorhabdus wittichii]|uniref:hypothetical protein n=1 Tax=Rhizorhabdus wittichii TaxID=160791 RepID=UPI000381E973|nr:hypothetical protein [Rhizorhabdus wittichii]